MNLTIAAIRSGTEPVDELPPGSFHRWLDEPILCPKCDAAYNLVVAWDQATDRHFAEQSRPLVAKLRKAIFMGHGDSHAVTHFETSGVVVKSLTKTSTRSPAKVLPESAAKTTKRPDAEFDMPKQRYIM